MFEILKQDNKENNITLSVKWTGKELEKAIDKVYNENKFRFNVPGFRKGKVPFAVVVKMYGIEMFFEDAVRVLIEENQENMYNFVEENVSQPVLFAIQPQMEVTKEITLKDGVELTAKFVLAPNAEIEDYKKITLELPAAEDIDTLVDEKIEAQRKQNAVWKETTKKAKNGNIVNIDFEGFKDGVAFEGGKGEGYDLQLGSNTFIPGFEDQLVGTKKGEEKDVVVTFPEEYHSADLAGKEATFKVKVNEVKEEVLPELDDEFAKDLGHATLKELREETKKEVEKQQEQEMKDKKVQALVKELANMSKFEVAQEEVNLINQRWLQQMSSYGLTPDAIAQMTGKNLTELLKEREEQIKESLKGKYAMLKIAALEKLLPLEKEIEAKYKEILAQNGGEEVDPIVQKILKQSAQEMLAQEAAEKFLLDKIKVKEVKAAKKATTKKTTTKKATADKEEKKTTAKKTTTKKETKKEEK